MIRRLHGRRDRFVVGIERSAEGFAVKAFGDDAPAEYEKALAMEAALAGTPFGVPRVLGYDAENGQIQFEYLPNMTLLQELLEQAYSTRQFDRVTKLNYEAARLLGILHQRLELPNARPWQPPPFLVQQIEQAGRQLKPHDDVYLHCDYSPVNLLVDRSDRVAIIDPSPNSYFTNYACLKGPRLVDIANYTAKLFWPYRLRSHSRTWRNMARELRQRFVEAYEETAATTMDRRLLAIFEDAVVRAFVEWKSTSRAIRSLALGLARIGWHRPE